MGFGDKPRMHNDATRLAGAMADRAGGKADA
jgi:hypothetical protein